MKALIIKNNKSSRSVLTEKYLKEICRYPLVSHEEETELFRAYHNGDMSAGEKLAHANLRFVVSVANHYHGPNIPIDDLISVGNFGLMIAIDRFDPSRGIKFISYAVWWIRQAILSEINDNSRTIRIPSNMIVRNSRRLRETGEEMQEMSNARVVSLNAPMGDGESEMITMLRDPNAPMPDDVIIGKPAVHYLVDMLKPRERAIIRMRYGIGHSKTYTYDEISKMLEMDLTRERVRQICEKAIRRLRIYARGIDPDILFE